MTARSRIKEEDCWDVDSLYSSVEEWYGDFKRAKGQEQEPHWPALAAYRGNLSKGVDSLVGAIQEIVLIDRSLSKLLTYAHLRHDEDLAETEHKKMYALISNTCDLFEKENAWFRPEILAMPSSDLEKFLRAPELKEYRLFLDRIVRMRPHTLTKREEEIIALSHLATRASQKAFVAFNDADLKFPKIKAGNDELKELTHGTYLLYLRDEDRLLRKNAFQTMYSSFRAFENTVAEFLNGEVQRHIFSKKTRGFASCMEAALFPFEIDPEVYRQLIATVRAQLSIHHRYLKKRKRWLGLEELHLYDLHVPCVSGKKIVRSFEEAAQDVCSSSAPLGREYQAILEKGLFKERWVDRYENEKKRSGAYSGGCYDSMPYILMNFHGELQDVKTLAHECGHSMHSYLSRKNQPYLYADYAIFVAEVASTFHEELLLDYLLEQMKEPELRALLINQRIEDIRSTLFRQTMFAEFEWKIHSLAEEGVPLTPALLKMEYRKLNQEYFGSEVVIDEEIDWEWARIPHFYYNFYVYQYATGISAAFALYDKVKKGGEKEREQYLNFLKAGSSKGPLEILQDAGVDMRKPDAIVSLLARFDALVSELDTFFP
jgi:oligoendopeptidase F